MSRSLKMFSLVTLNWLMACAGDKDPNADKDLGADSAADTEAEGVIDDDGDGVRVEYDCDDNDASVYPGAAEPCDERDNDCDGSVDEGANASYFADDDGDGFGRDSSDLLACAAPEGYVAIGGDCDDNNSSAFPDAQEVCDGADNNCDGAVDEGVTIAFYADDDADGFGREATMVLACVAPEGHTSTVGDCDDGDPGANPEAEERCDGTDNNCDGAVDEGVTIAYYTDDDGDGDGDLASAAMACELPSGAVLSAGDCDDNNPNLNSNDVDEDGLATCDGDCDDNDENRAAICEYATLAGGFTVNTSTCIYTSAGATIDPTTQCPTCDFGFLTTNTLTRGSSCSFAFTSLYAYDIDAGSMKFLASYGSGLYEEQGPFAATLSFGATYDTLSFYGVGPAGRTYSGSFTLHP